MDYALKRILLALILFAAPAYAEDRPIDMTQPILDAQGHPAKDASQATKEDEGCAKCPTLTLGRVVQEALLAVYPDEEDPRSGRTLAADQKWARGVLAMRVVNDPKAVLSAEEVALIKRLVGKSFGPITVMQVFPILDPNAKPPTAQ